jgi:anaerobic selenocysteine-containing dehydrogenase
LQAFDDKLVAADVQKLAGDAAPLLMQAVAHHKGPDRLLELALRGGPYGDGFGLRDPQAAQPRLTLAKVKNAPGGIDLGPLTPRVPELLRTPSGRIELAPPALLADLPRARADLHTPAPALVLIGRRDMRSNNSWMHNLHSLAKGPLRCTALVNPADAARLGLLDGQTAALRSTQGALHVVVQHSAAMAPGVVSLPHGWGHSLPGARLALAALRPGVNMNDLLDDSLRDPLSGNAVLSGIEVSLTAEVSA